MKCFIKIRQFHLSIFKALIKLLLEAKYVLKILPWSVLSCSNGLKHFTLHLNSLTIQYTLNAF